MRVGQKDGRSGAEHGKQADAAFDLLAISAKMKSVCGGFLPRLVHALNAVRTTKHSVVGRVSVTHCDSPSRLPQHPHGDGSLEQNAALYRLVLEALCHVSEWKSSVLLFVAFKFQVCARGILLHLSLSLSLKADWEPHAHSSQRPTMRSSTSTLASTVRTWSTSERHGTTTRATSSVQWPTWCIARKRSSTSSAATLGSSPRASGDTFTSAPSSLHSTRRSQCSTERTSGNSCLSSCCRTCA